MEESRAWVGTQEAGGNNQGRHVERFQRSIGSWAKHQPWCASFVSYCIWECERITNKLSPIAKNASVEQMWLKTPFKCRVEKPTPGCLVLFKSVKGTGGHIGIVTDASKFPVISSIEGNTSPSPGVEREGDGVFEKTHNMEKLKGFKLVGYLDPEA